MFFSKPISNGTILRLQSWRRVLYGPAAPCYKKKKIAFTMKFGVKHRLFYLENSLCEDESCSYDGLVGCGESHLHVWLQQQNIYLKNSSPILFILSFQTACRKTFIMHVWSVGIFICIHAKTYPNKRVFLDALLLSSGTCHERKYGATWRNFKLEKGISSVLS